ncbi:uroporphyrinogen-III synthase [Asaia bogorensis]|uniref:uroporphyrinogen-III synthase n=1 Tax=Asaia bogorensis TaxID=91915 RepID=UPI0013C4A334|nr:uroporphyrinogen-III synthase [Asaia bogorensis]
MADTPRRTILVTRPEPGLSDTRRALEALGWEPHLAPMLRIMPMPLRPLSPVGRVVVTSGQSLDSLRDVLPLQTPLTAVGARTAERARACGFSHVDHADGDARSLLQHLGRPRSDPSLLLATGRGLGGTLARDLRNQGWRVTRRVVYHTAPAGTLDDATRALLAKQRIAAVLFYSAATARAFLSALGPDSALLSTVRALALSDQIGDALRPSSFADIAIAVRPEQEALLDLLGPSSAPVHDTQFRKDAR